MRPLIELLERFDGLWDQAEELIASHFAALAQSPSQTDDPTLPPDLKDLNTLITMLKRVQDARRAIQADARKMQESQRDADQLEATEGIDPMDDKEISRLRELLCEGDEEEEGTDQSPM